MNNNYKRQYIKTFETFKKNRRNTDSINEGLLSNLFNFFKKLWSNAVEDLKKLGEKPTMQELSDWVSKNFFNPSSDKYLFKNVIEDFKKNPTPGDQNCLEVVGSILDPETGILGKQNLNPLYDDLLKNFGKNLAPVDAIQYYFDTIRNRAIVDYKYAGGPANGQVNQNNINLDVNDTTHLPDLKKLLLTATQPADKLNATVNWIQNNLLPRLTKYLQEIKPEDVNKYLASKNLPPLPLTNTSVVINIDTLKEAMNKKQQIVFLQPNHKIDEWNKLSDDIKKNPISNADAMKIVNVSTIDTIDEGNKTLNTKDSTGKVVTIAFADIVNILVNASAVNGITIDALTAALNQKESVAYLLQNQTIQNWNNLSIDAKNNPESDTEAQKVVGIAPLKAVDKNNQTVTLSIDNKDVVYKISSIVSITNANNVTVDKIKEAFNNKKEIIYLLDKDKNPNAFSMEDYNKLSDNDKKNIKSINNGKWQEKIGIKLAESVDDAGTCIFKLADNTGTFKKTIDKIAGIIE